MNTQTLTLQETLLAATAQLGASSDSARLDAELLLCHALQKPRSYLFAHAKDLLDADTASEFRRYLLRRINAEPVAYITGRKEFWSLQLEVTPATLVPRPETECLVQLASEKLAGLVSPVVADLGTGSGAIALALASEFPRGRFVATDISEEALAVAQRNAARLGIDTIEFRQGDWTTPIAGEMFDIIVSNPPYVRQGDPALLALQHEPVSALSAGPAGLDAISRLVVDCLPLTRPGGWLLLEHGAEQALEVARLFAQAGWRSIASVSDLAGRPRVTLGRKAADT